MKKVLSIFAGTVFVLAFGMAYAGELQPGSEYPSDKMIGNEDLPKYDQGQGTFNLAPVLPDEQGSAAGGSAEPDSTWKSDTYEQPAPVKPAPVEKDTVKPSDSGSGMGGPSDDGGAFHY